MDDESEQEDEDDDDDDDEMTDDEFMDALFGTPSLLGELRRSDPKAYNELLLQWLQ